ncbi:polysaccharide biosynthesis protein [Syntrophobotulus glycolicus DSM 8271]|uniref:Polysaccharide biosynthesis protein n=1 Tax=Syntrophobotulus glycolicus (strain DSM 8271 / FlGlyR) TaxID=645991 RepID=F0SY69_SYNGF|nr:lipopolysaccharide biosynthesis protein [Syntrophobotulus glycolicus]ADY55904.1 polysaccharide biosynthesis protein [Syntrophobotulus glycolicus DSM 8271]
MEENDLAIKAGDAAKWSTITEIAAKLIIPITNMILARFLAPEAFGVVTTITMIISFAGLFSDAGFQSYLIQREFKDEEERKKSTNVAFITNLTIAFALWGLIALFRDQIARSAGNPDLGLVVAIACVQIPLTSFSSIQTALFRREFNFKSLFLARIVSSVIPLIITVPLAMIGFQYWSLIIGSTCGILANAIMLTVKSKWRPELYYNFALLREMFSFSVWSLMEAISIWFTLWIDALIIGNSFSAYYLGLYKNSLNMVNSFMSLVTASIIPILFSVLSRLQNDDTEFQAMYYKTQRFISYLVLPLGFGIFLYSDLVTNIMFGSQWIEASNIIGIWAFVAAFGIIFSNFNGEVYRSKGKPRLSFIYQIIHLTFLIPTCLISMKFGFWSLVYARSLIRFQGTIVGFIFMRAFMGFSLKDMLSNVAKPLCSTLLMSLIAIGLKQISSAVIWSFISILICAFMYVSFIILIDRGQISEIIKLFRDKTKR